MKKKVTLIILAMDEEFNHLLNKINGDYILEKHNDENWYFFSKNNVNYLAIRGRVGKVSTAYYLGQLSEKFNIERIFNLGTSGGYNKEVAIGDVIIANKVIYHDVDATGFGYQSGQVPGFPKEYLCDLDFLSKKPLKEREYKIHQGLISSGDSFITKLNVEKFFINDQQPLCVEMEAGAVGQCAYLMNIPFIAIRSISDIIHKNTNVQDSEINLDIASANCVDVLFQLID